MKVIDAMLNKIKSPALLMGFSKIMDAASDCFVTDFSQDQISALVRMQLSDFANWDIQSYTVTGSSGTSTQCYSAKGQKLYVMKPDEASVSKAKEMIATVLGGEGTERHHPDPGKDRHLYPHHRPERRCCHSGRTGGKRHRGTARRERAGGDPGRNAC